MRKSFSLAAVTLALLSTSFATEIGIVNFSSCISDSKMGQKEQGNIDTLRKQMASMMEESENKLRDLSSKFEDTEYMDSLSPKAEEEMKMSYQNLTEDLGRYQQQFYQMIQGANYQLIQKMSHSIGTASEKIAKQKKLDYVINKEACFYAGPNFDVTSLVIQEMDKSFDLENKDKKLSENESAPEPTVGGAG